MNNQSYLGRALNHILIRIFKISGQKLASRINIDYRKLLAQTLFEPNLAVTTNHSDRSNISDVCELVIEIALDKIADESEMSRSGAAQDIVQTLAHKVKNRMGDLQTKIGLDNEDNRAEWLKKTLHSLPPGIRLLDAGAGEQQYKKYCQHLNYVSQDFAQYDGLGNAAGLQTGSWDYGAIDIVSDICKIPEPDKSFDVILCTEVFEHISNPIDAICEFSRLLKTGGTLILSAPFSSLTHFAPHYYYTGFSRFFFEKILPEYGFRNIKINYNSGYFDYLAQEIHRLPSVAERYASETLAKELSTNAWLLQKTLSVCAEQDNGSSELLTYGLHVTAQRA